MSISEGAMQPESFERREKGTMRTDERRRRTEFPKNTRRERKNPLSLQKKNAHTIFLSVQSVTHSPRTHSLLESSPDSHFPFLTRLPASCLTLFCAEPTHTLRPLSLSLPPRFSHFSLLVALCCCCCSKSELSVQMNDDPTLLNDWTCTETKSFLPI